MVQTLVVVEAVGSSCGRPIPAAELSRSHDRLVDPAFWQTSPADLRVPLLSQEGPTCRLLPGAAAPWSPALDPVLAKFSAPAMNYYCYCFGLCVCLSDCRTRPLLPNFEVRCGRLGIEVA